MISSPLCGMRRSCTEERVVGAGWKEAIGDNDGEFVGLRTDRYTASKESSYRSGECAMKARKMSSGRSSISVRVSDRNLEAESEQKTEPYAFPAIFKAFNEPTLVMDCARASGGRYRG